MLEDIWYSYDNVEFVLKGVDLSLREPGLYIVIGPNGSGKTTLLKIMSLILKPVKGKVLVNGVDYWSLSDDEKREIRRHIVYVHDKPIMLRGSVEYNIVIGTRLRGFNDKALIDRYVDRYGLRNILGKHASQLSAGQAKIVSIIRALVLKPRVLILDEPFTFLEPSKIDLLLEDLGIVVEGGGTVVLSTHYMYKKVLSMARDVLELYGGMITGRGISGFV
ncbi:MAG: ABC transporter ATP-binding protein [Desulfurococcaceae archaeon]